MSKSKPSSSRSSFQGEWEIDPDEGPALKNTLYADKTRHQLNEGAVCMPGNNDLLKFNYFTV